MASWVFDMESASCLQFNQVMGGFSHRLRPGTSWTAPLRRRNGSALIRSFQWAAGSPMAGVLPIAAYRSGTDERLSRSRGVAVSLSVRSRAIIKQDAPGRAADPRRSQRRLKPKASNPSGKENS
jgi:hypothetical protein